MASAQARLLPNGRLHLQHGPIDLVIEAEAGSSIRYAVEEKALQAQVRAAYEAASARFATILTELCDELPTLRSPAGRLDGAIARRMQAAILPFAAATFITPMAAVAGAVADEILRVMIAAAPLRRAFVNNGGDIALHLAPGQSTRIGLVDRPDRPGLFGTATLSAADGIGGIATSGWRGRSFSLGIADAVTVLARNAAEADAAATVIANAVDLPGHPAVLRVAAQEIQADSDLGGRPVTRGVATLAAAEIEGALAAGLARAEALVGRGLISGAALHVQGRTAATGAFDPRRHAEEAGPAGRIDARTTDGACFETRTSGPLLSMRPSRSMVDFASLGRAA